MPMLSDIEFDRNGSLILSFRDRFADMAGHRNYRPSGETDLLTSSSAGDILRACKVGASFVMEGNTGCASNSVSANNLGINGGEFYGQEFFGTPPAGSHLETSFGATEYVPGFPEVITTAMDPNGLDSGGALWFSNSSGSRLDGLELYVDASSPQPSTFGKSNGLGDIEALCDEAPVQIGNRVWNDTDGDGVQDAGEPGIGEVTVRMYASDGSTLLGTAVTNSSGEYYFSSNNSEAVAGTGDAFGGGLPVGAAVVLKLNEPADAATGGALNGLQLTTANATTAATTDRDDSIDSDATLAGFPTISVPAHAAGQNDHTYDVGFRPPVLSASLAGTVWIDQVLDGQHAAATELEVEGVTVILCDASGAEVRRMQTDSAGNYLFDNLEPGSYCVRFLPPTGYALTAANLGADSTDSDADRTSGQTGHYTVNPGDAIIDVDAGLFRPAAVSGVVYVDSNLNQANNGGDLPISNVTLTLTCTTVLGDAVTMTTTTDATGAYSFDGLMPGTCTVTQTQPTGYGDVATTVGSVGGNGATNVVQSITLNQGDVSSSNNFGERLVELPATR